MLQFDSNVNINGTSFLGYFFVCEEERPIVKKYGKHDKYKYDARLFSSSTLATITFEEMVARLYNLSNQNIFEQGDEYKTSFDIIGSFNGKPFTLYDWKGDNCVHIGGHDDLEVPALRKELFKLIKKTSPKPYTAQLHYDSCYDISYSYPINDYESIDEPTE